MKKLTISWRVKFRAFGITFGNVQGEWSHPVPDLMEPLERVLVNDRGVLIVAKVV